MLWARGVVDCAPALSLPARRPRATHPLFSSPVRSAPHLFFFFSPSPPSIAHPSSIHRPSIAHPSLARPPAAARRPPDQDSPRDRKTNNESPPTAASSPTSDDDDDDSDDDDNHVHDGGHVHDGSHVHDGASPPARRPSSPPCSSVALAAAALLSPRRPLPQTLAPRQTASAAGPPPRLGVPLPKDRIKLQTQLAAAHPPSPLPASAATGPREPALQRLQISPQSPQTLGPVFPHPKKNNPRPPSMVVSITAASPHRFLFAPAPVRGPRPGPRQTVR
ncbi:hypothetical protein CDD83_3146 [Cordyceps sp. RAO-2017]|nr:hypothetical protein CDD83_3146 [Cordyceps sp. RAO-2017]